MGKGSAARHAFIVANVFADVDVTAQLEAMVKAACGGNYKQKESKIVKDLTTSYEAGYRWMGSTIDPSDEPDVLGDRIRGGPFLGRAVLWKLQVGIHRDAKDYLCVILNSGEYDGGAALFPDLGLKLE